MPDLAPPSGEFPSQALGIDVYTDANNGALNLFNAPLMLHTSGVAGVGATLNSGTGAPTIAGNVGDLYINVGAASDGVYFYRCTTAGAAGAAVWAAITGA